MTVLTRGAYAEPATSLHFKTGTWRVQKPVHQHHPAPCHHACPAGEDAQAYLAHLQAGHIRAAWEEVVRANPLPAVTGRVCPHPCEHACNRGEYDEPVAIHAVERFLGDEAIAKGWAYPVEPPPAGAPEVAVVGAGPAGLSAAYHLIRQGIKVTVFEDRTEAGGTLRMGIPQYRLPREVLDAEVNRILALDGITFKPHTRLGRDVHLRELQEQYAAVFLGPGAQRSREWNIDGVAPKDLQYGLELLQEWMDVGKVPTPNSVAVVGAGNTAVDVARIMRRAGVGEVHLISHKPIPGPNVPPSEAMPAIEREVHEAIEEGVKIHEYRGIRRLILRGEKVVGVELVHMKKLVQPSGRLKRVAFTGTESILNVDQVIPAIGQVINPLGMESIVDNSHLRVDPWGRLRQDKLYSGGDATPNDGTVTAAVGDGRRAALAIAADIRQQALPESEQRGEPLGYKGLNLVYYEPQNRAQEPLLPVEERTKDCRETVSGLNQAAVLTESRRCFSCGNCLACDNCWTLCPDSAVLKTKDLASDGSHYVFDYDYCKGCGLCAYECPCGYIEMVEEL